MTCEELPHGTADALDQHIDQIISFFLPASLSIPFRTITD